MQYTHVMPPPEEEERDIERSPIKTVANQNVVAASSSLRAPHRPADAT